MSKKKLFVSPRVIQEVQVQLEKDFLQGDSVRFDTKLSSMGQGEATYFVNEDPAAAADGDLIVEW